MDWKMLLTFIETRDPGFTAASRGVPRTVIEQCMNNCEAEFPQTYVEFLLCMGRSSGEFHPFGRTMQHRFDDLVAQLPAEDYAGDRYFKIAYENDRSSVAFYDLFLDLQRSDGHDAPLVTFEDGAEVRPGAVDEVGETFAERLTESCFEFFALDRCSERTSVAFDRPATQQRISAVLASMDFTLVLDPLERIACFSNGSFYALVKTRGDSQVLDVELGAESRTELAAVAAQLEAHLGRM